MQYGIWIGAHGSALGDIVDSVAGARAAGLTSAWLGGNDGWDSLTTLAVVGNTQPDIKLGTAIVTTYPRHPLVLASQALSVQAVTGNRLTLGIGVSNRFVVEAQYGYRFDAPVEHLRDYLAALTPLVSGETVAQHGRTITAAGTVAVPGARKPSILIAALGTKMLRLAGQTADGTITNWATPIALAEHITPTITSAAAEAGRANPRVVAATFVCVTNDEAARRELVASQFGRVEQVPSYRAILDRGHAAGAADAAVIGDESAVERQLFKISDAGATELVAHPLGSKEEQARTVGLLGELQARALGELRTSQPVSRRS